MPSYSKNVSVPGKTSQQLYDKISTEIDQFMQKSNISKYEVERDAVKKQVHLKSSMLTATLFCEEGKLRLDGKLSLLATPFRSKIDEGIEKWVHKNFA